MLFGRNGISRRTVLRGVLAGGISVAVPLPRLGAMLNGNGTAYADGMPLPTRFGFWFFGNGHRHRSAGFRAARGSAITGL